MRREDSHVVTLAREADRLTDRDPRAAAQMIRETVLPRARANAAAASALRPRHPLAERLAERLARLTDERVARFERYAAALDGGDTAALLREVRAQRELEDEVVRLDRRIEAAARIPPSRGCGAPAR